MSKQFTIVGEEYVGYMQGNAYIISNGECKFSLWERKEKEKREMEKEELIREVIKRLEVIGDE